VNGSRNLDWLLALVVVVVPVLIIAAAELDERLRQRRSALRPAVVVIRTWGLAFLALWVLLVPILELDRDGFAVRVAASGLVLSLAAAVLSVVRALVDGYRSRPRDDESRAMPQLVLALPRLVTILVAGWLLIDTVWGVDLSAALTALGVTSLVVSFALQDTLSGLASGLLLLSDQPFKPGDWIRAGEAGTEGLVVDMNWRTARLRTRDGDTVIVPNSELAGAAVVNLSSPDPRHRVVVSMQVAFVNPPTRAIEMLLDAARSVPGVLSDPPPAVRVVQIDDPLMGYDVDMWIDDFAIEPRVRSDFGRLVWYQSHRHDVPLPSPAQDLYLYDGVQAGESAVPTTADLRNGLQASPLLASLDDDELDSLAVATRLDRYSRGEEIVPAGSTGGELRVIRDGHARMVLPTDGIEHVVAELSPGEGIGILDLSSPALRRVLVRAVTDCEVLTVDATVIGGIGSRNAELAAALNRVATIRRRRVERTVERSGSAPT
jgi:small-conductance mechanosensitive channel